MEERFVCPFCGRDDIYRKCSLTQHINRCKENPDRVIKIVSGETKQKISEAKKGKTFSDEHKQKLSEAIKGKTHSEETKKKMSEALKGRTSPMKGKTFSEEYKQKISEAVKKAYENPEYKQKMSEAQNRPEVKQKKSETMNRPEVQQKIYNTKKKNNSFNTSKIEEQLKEYFTSHNINFKTQYKSAEYPFMCDFYFPDKDLYVEIQGSWTHGGRPFNNEDEECIKQLKKWKSKNTDFYNNAIETWTIRDVNKRNCAKEHNLNWIEIFSFDLDECLETIMNLP